MKKCWALLSCCLLLLIGGSLAPGSTVLGMETYQDQVGGYWQLVQTLEDPGDTSFEQYYFGTQIHCSSITASWSNGQVSHTHTAHKEILSCNNSENSFFSVSASWTPPPQKIHPEENIPHNLSAVTHEFTGNRGGAINISMRFNNNHVCTMSISGTYASDPCDDNTFTVQAGNPQLGDRGTKMEIVVDVWVTGGQNAHLDEKMNSTGTYTYVYEWVEEVLPTATMTPSPIPEPTNTETPDVLVTIAGSIRVTAPIAALSSPLMVGLGGTALTESLPLDHAKVFLLHNGQVIDQTISGPAGLYWFDDVNVTENLSIRVELALGSHEVGGKPYLQVVYDQQDDPISFSTPPYEIDPNDGDFVSIDILVDYLHDLEYTPAQLQRHQLVDAALTYYYLASGWEMASVNLQQPFDLPTVARIFSSNPGAYMSAPMISNNGVVNYDVYINLAPVWSSYLTFDPRWTVLHEFGHHLMADVYDNFFPFHDDNVNHAGFANPSTTDSWTEGFATFFAAWTQRDFLAFTFPHLANFIMRDSAGKVHQWHFNLEENKLAWSRGLGEEFAVAALLWDLIDPIDRFDCTAFPVFDYASNPIITRAANQEYTYYCDHVQLTSQQLWEIITGNAFLFEYSNSPHSPANYDHIFDMKDLYRNLKSNYWLYAVANGLPDITPNGLDPIDELFIAHGFFADISPQNLDFDPDETIGLTSHELLEIAGETYLARPGRRVPPPPPDSYIGYRLYDPKSRSYLPPEEGDIFLVEVFYDPPFELYNYSFVTRAGSAGKLLYYGPAEHYAATIRVSAVGFDREPVNVLEFSNAFYWQEGFGKGVEPFIEHVFEVRQQSRTGVNGWVLPAVLLSTGTLLCTGLIFILGVVIIIVIRRRRTDR